MKVKNNKRQYIVALIGVIRVLFPYLGRQSRVKLLKSHMAQFERLELPYSEWPTGWQKKIAIELTEKAKDIVKFRTYIKKLEGSDVMKKELGEYIKSIKSE